MGKHKKRPDFNKMERRRMAMGWSPCEPQKEEIQRQRDWIAGRLDRKQKREEVERLLAAATKEANVKVWGPDWEEKQKEFLSLVAAAKKEAELKAWGHEPTDAERFEWEGGVKPEEPSVDTADYNW